MGCYLSGWTLRQQRCHRLRRATADCLLLLLLLWLCYGGSAHSCSRCCSDGILYAAAYDR